MAFDKNSILSASAELGSRRRAAQGTRHRLAPFCYFLRMSLGPLHICVAGASFFQSAAPILRLPLSGRRRQQWHHRLNRLKSVLELNETGAADHIDGRDIGRR